MNDLRWLTHGEEDNIPFSSLLHLLTIYLDQLECSQNDLGWLAQGEEDDILFLLYSTL